MRIIQINCVYKTGSTGKIVADLHRFYLDKGHESFVFYGRGKRIKEKNINKVSSEFEAKIHSVLTRLFGLEFCYSLFSTAKTINLIKKIKPDVVHLHCLNGHFVNVYKLIEFLKNSGIKTVLTLHAELMHTAGCEHAMDCEKWINGCYQCHIVKGALSHFFRDDAKKSYSLMKKAFQNFDNLTVVGCSRWVMERAQKSLIFRNLNCNFTYIHNDVNYKVFKYIKNTKLKEMLGIDDGKKVILNVTSNFSYSIKGPEYFIEICRMLPEYQFIVVGFNGWKEKMPDNVITIARTNNQKELAEFYSISDCFISTSIRETLPTVCLEASACGCNVLAFDSGGSKETIEIGHGDVVTPYDINEYVSKIRYWANKERNYNQTFNHVGFCEKYLLSYKDNK